MNIIFNISDGPDKNGQTKTTISQGGSIFPTGGQDFGGEIGRVAQSAARFGVVPPSTLGVELRDITLWTTQYFQQLQALERLGARCPVIMLPYDKVAPLDIQHSVTASRLYAAGSWQIPDNQVAASVQNAMRVAHEAGFVVGEARIERAREGFADLLSDFLQVRTQAPNTGAQGGNSHPGINVTVHTRKSGLHVLATPKCWIQLAAAFSDVQSTPVTSLIVPGEYLFGAEGADHRKTWEDSTHKVPPTSAVHMLKV